MKIIIFGTGEYYENKKKELSDFEILAFADNDKYKWGKRKDGKEIVAPQHVKDYAYDKIVLMSQYRNEMREQLREKQGITDHVLTFEQLMAQKEIKECRILYKNWLAPQKYRINKSVLFTNRELGYHGGSMRVVSSMNILKAEKYVERI